ncbi:hypothetical protein [Phenylobacterium sp.]|uniref:hypothetical protein n=1 Tax=Phenylobacterium sp. TaxID=1871053 RepID=UPI00394F4CC1
MAGTGPTGLSTNCEMVLAHLRTEPDQRIVHQQPCPPGETGHCVFPESVYFRIGICGIRLPGGKVTFRRLLKAGWLTVAAVEGSAATGHQIEYRLSPGALERFDADPEWQKVERAWREVAKLPPRLKLIEGGAP